MLRAPDMLRPYVFVSTHQRRGELRVRSDRLDRDAVEGRNAIAIGQQVVRNISMLRCAGIRRFPLTKDL